MKTDILRYRQTERDSETKREREIQRKTQGYRDIERQIESNIGVENIA